jgi:hypothetical protein
MNARAWRSAVIRLLLTGPVFIGCGRSSILGAPGSGTDAGAFSDGGSPPFDEDSGPCGPSNCSNGCCLGNYCQPLPDLDYANLYCGGNGFPCLDCAGSLGCSNEPDGGPACESPPLPGCNCPGGCCTADLACQPGTTNSACGSNQNLCDVCPANGSCGSAFEGDKIGYGCLPTVAPPSPGCGTCSGCCTGGGPPGTTGTCMDGTSNTACGFNGSSCWDCTTEGLFCLPLSDDGGNARGCVNTGCGPGTCDGCCDSTGTCQDGFVDGACGSGGATCTDCTTQGSTCDETVSPRVCTNEQSSCPAPYPACSSGVTTGAPVVQSSACGSSDLSQASAACAGGATSTACLTFFQAEKANVDGGTTCAACLQPFDVSFADGEGIYLCAAPFLDASCNEDTGCYIDCETKSCLGCASGEVAPCETDQQTANCAIYTNGLTCVQAAFTGGGAFCNPSGYANFGVWLGAVGAYYCGAADAGP